MLGWLLSGSLQAAIPFWLPFTILAATELEFLVRGLRERGAHRPRDRAADVLERRLPGSDDADLGWVEEIDEEGLPILVPAPPAPPPPRHRLLLALGAVVAAVLFVVALRVDTRDTWQSLDTQARARTEQRLSRVAGEIARRQVAIRCDDGYAFTGVGSDAAGVAFIRSGIAYLEPDVCRTLYDIIAGDVPASREDAAFAITVLAHEATHLRGVRNEAVTECYALQEGAKLGARLGLERGEARDLVRAQFERDLGDRSVERLGYRLPAECRDGGTLDLRPGDRSFP